MKPTNLISAFQGLKAFNECKDSDQKEVAPYKISVNEATVLGSFCDLLNKYDCPFDVFDGYYIGYSINQISKEFDLLRFSEDLVINIELKQELNLSDKEKIEKILKQQSKNFYYLKALQKSVFICTCVENNGLYEYDNLLNETKKISCEELIDILKNQNFDINIDPDKLFIPSNYLVSPFNSTERFLDGEYFLTGSQEEIKNELIKKITSDYVMYCITADAGTGKTLLLYDIAKTISESNKTILIHCGKLNEGHELLRDKFNWNICAIKGIQAQTIDRYIDDTVTAIFIDESQRIRTHQLEMIIGKSKELKIPIVFSYDTKQYLSEGESKNIYEYIKTNYPEISIYMKSLTNKIRTNKNISSFITNLIQIGKSNSYLNYSDITIEYFENLNDIRRYIEYLEENEWKFITYTSSQYQREPIDTLASLSDFKAHDVIGQEFKKVVFVMDDNFRYDDSGKLQYRKCFYSLPGMFYQIITRVINEMKIIVFNNKSLYYKLLQIKSLDKNNE
ncbi:ATP-binding protein [uncultured Ruminococcus sp.]|uniref:ATP-binding protein n=1 Tax=uncultured Ruminococcus sp. TaxID=165186 RepID=UPI0025F29261|nr:ATP-binding protein [uncultured Ruminococcus sp.]